MQGFIDEGNGFVACRRRFGIAHWTWMRAIGRGDIVVDTAGKPYADARKRYNWAIVRAYYEMGFTLRECRKRFGFSLGSWHKAVKRGDIRPRRQRLELETVLASSPRRTVKRHLIQAGILENRCDWCGLDEWRGKPLAIQIDHVNGIKNDNRIENLRMLCPNCHSQTDTFAARNLKSRNRSRIVQR